jgi:flagellum-specific peptidoglycan hydrolase FlgJ
MATQPPETVIAAAKAAAAKWRIPASVMIAQWALESGWGRREPPGSNNPFGEKAPAGTHGASTPTLEIEDGRVVHTTAVFRAFLNLEDAFDFHAEHLATSHWFMPARACLPDVKRFCDALGGGTAAKPSYSTSPVYGQSLMAIIRDSKLAGYDA